jgi:hypothetical protein
VEHASQTDRSPVREPLQQLGRNLRALANQHQNFGLAESLDERFQFRNAIVPDGDRVARE